MTKRTVGVLHPGEMGIYVAATAQNSGCEVYWASENRSPRTRERAEKLGLKDAGTLADLCRQSEVLVSVCPPHAAEDTADRVRECGFRGIYLDANAVSPERAKRIGRSVTESGARFVDGGIIGLPVWKQDQTFLYLSGPEAEMVVQCFAAGPLMPEAIGERPGAASALKMCYAAYTKGTTALLCAIFGAADALGVVDRLQVQWAREGSELADTAAARVRGVTAKAWRFIGEMGEISATFRATGMPGGFHDAAADVYRRIEGFKGAASLPELEEVLGALKSGTFSED